MLIKKKNYFGLNYGLQNDKKTDVHWGQKSDNKTESSVNVVSRTTTRLSLIQIVVSRMISRPGLI